MRQWFLLIAVTSVITPFGSSRRVGSLPAKGRISGALQVLPLSVERKETSRDLALLPVRAMASRAPSLVGDTVDSSQGVVTVPPALMMADGVVMTERTSH